MVRGVNHEPTAPVELVSTVTNSMVSTLHITAARPAAIGATSPGGPLWARQQKLVSSLANHLLSMLMVELSSDPTTDDAMTITDSATNTRR
jgi:hypothetical protein